MTENKNKFNIKSLVTGLVSVIALTIIDQLLKLWSVSTLMNKEPIVIIDGVLELRYLENNGAAFGMLQNATVFFLILTVVILAVAVVVYIKTPYEKRFDFLRLTLILLTAGAIGNFIDRAVHTYVVDFIYFRLIDFPIFNFADICVTFAEIFLVIAIIFVYKEDDYKKIFNSKEKSVENK